LLQCSDNNRRLILILASVFSLCFVLGSYKLSDFVLDDAFITFRYSQNLASGHGIRWNLDEGPLEGFTSFSWMLLNAAAIKAGFDPLLFSQLLSVASALLAIWLIGARPRAHPLAASIGMAGLALSPAFALITVSGMETAFCALLVLLFSLCSLSLEDNFTRNTIWLFLLALVCFLSRYDLVAFFVPVIICHLAMQLARRQWRELGTFSSLAVVSLALASSYLVWKSIYYGDLFPTSFYVKLRGFCLPGLEYVLGFMAQAAFPYLIISLLLLSVTPYEYMRHVLPVGAGLACFSSFFLLVEPIQGFLWRFLMPIYPLLLLLFVVLASHADPFSLFARGRPLAILAAALLLAYPLHTLQETWSTKRGRNSTDRVAVGRALAGLQGSLFTSESGALPYFSGWKAADVKGLNVSTIARNGLSYNYLTAFKPDLIMLVAPLGRFPGRFPDPKWKRDLIVGQYIMKEGYVPVAAVKKGGARCHIYFVRNASPLSREIVDRLNKVEGIERLDVQRVVDRAFFERALPGAGGSEAQDRPGPITYGHQSRKLDSRSPTSTRATQ
jgi:arabinofuranosyltransferase